jgi:hypothetical protein
VGETPRPNTRRTRAGEAPRSSRRPARTTSACPRPSDALFGALVGGFVRACENLAARAICSRMALSGDLSLPEKRALAVERVVLGDFGSLAGKRRALLFAGGHRPAGTRGMVRFEVASRQGLSQDGRPTRVFLHAIVVNTRPEGEQLRWRTAERLPGSGRPLRFADHGSVESALLAYAPPASVPYGNPYGAPRGPDARHAP